MTDNKEKESQSFRDQYNITVHGDYQNYPEVKSVTYSNTYHYYSGSDAETTELEEAGNGQSPMQNDSKAEPFDIEKYPTAHLKFIRAVSDKERKAEVMRMREDFAAEAGKYDDISHRKQELLCHVFEPRILRDKIIRIPSHMVTTALFGDVLNGVSKQAHNVFRKEMLLKYRKLRPAK